MEVDGPVGPDTDIFGELEIGGDDFHKMMQQYSGRFGVDLSGYRWYFHTDEKGGKSIGGWFFAPPYARVKRIPVTPGMLACFANTGKWELQYPPHTIPKVRYDILVNQVLYFGAVIALAVVILEKCSR